MRSTYATQVNLVRLFKDDPDGTYNAFKSPQNILVMVAGGVGLYSMVMPNWGGAGHQNRAVSVKVESDFFLRYPRIKSAW